MPTEFTIIPDLVKIRSNTDYIHYFSFAESLNHVFKNANAKIVIDFSIVKDISKPKDLDKKFHFFFGQTDDNRIYFERPLLGGKSAKMLVTFDKDQVVVSVNSYYYKMVKFKIDNLFPPGVHLTDITSIKLLEKGYAPVHGSCISLNDRSILVSAPPDTGKSLTSFLASKQGFGFLSEDITVVDNIDAYSVPLSSTFVYFLPNRNFSFYDLASKVGALSYFVEKPRINLRDIIEDLHITERAEVQTICILERGKDDVRELSKEEAFRKILLNNRNEFSYHKNTLIFAYSYFNSRINLQQLMRNEEELLATIIKKSKCFALVSNNPKNYFELLEKVVR